MASRWTRIIAVFFVVACMGCTPLYRAGSVVVGTVGEDRMPFDRLFGLMHGKDCSAIRANKGGHWCQPFYENKPYVQDLYCYRTLARKDCFRRPSPHPYDHLVGFIPEGRQRTW